MIFQIAKWYSVMDPTECTCSTVLLLGKDFSLWKLNGAIMSQTCRSREINQCVGNIAEAPWGFSDKWGDPSHFSCWTSTALFKLSNRKSGKCSNRRQRKRKNKIEVKCYKIKETMQVNSLTLNKKKRHEQSMVLHKVWLQERKETIWFTACVAQSIHQM